MMKADAAELVNWRKI